MNTNTDNHRITDAFSKVTIQHPSAWVHEDLLHREINQWLLDHGQDTIPRDFLDLEMDIRGYQWLHDACGRAYWQGIGVLANREEETVVEAGELYPIKTNWSRINNRQDIWAQINMEEDRHRPTETPPWDDED